MSGSWKYSEQQQTEFNKIRQEAPTYYQKNDLDRFNKWKNFIIHKGYKPRNVIDKEAMEQDGLTETERLEEIKLGLWAKRANHKSVKWQYPEQQAEFEGIWQKTSAYWRKNKINKFNKWEKFIARNGYKPRTEISQKVAEKMV